LAAKIEQFHGFYMMGKCPLSKGHFDATACLGYPKEFMEGGGTGVFSHEN
jgi:hypothetical protein